MRVEYGTFQHAIDLVKCDIVIRKIREADGHGKYLVNKKLSISGALVGYSTEADLDAAMAQMEAAYSVEFQSGGLLRTDGVRTQHYLSNPASYGGVRVNFLHWGGSSKAEFQSLRSFDLELEADFLSTSFVVSLNETVEIIGTGGPRYGYVELMNGVPQRQTVNQLTLVRAVQRGSGVWTTGTHAIPGPIWPTLEDQERRSISRVRISQNTQQYSRSWAYHFTNSGPFIVPPLATSFNLWQDGREAVWQNGDTWVWST